MTMNQRGRMRSAAPGPSSPPQMRRISSTPFMPARPRWKAIWPMPSSALIAANALCPGAVMGQGSAPQLALSDTARFSLIIAVNEDRPFLFDSAVAAMIAGGAQIQSVFHPVLTVNGRKLSLIVFVIDSGSRCGALVRQRLTARSAGMLSRLAAAAVARLARHAAVRLQTARDELAAAPPRAGGIGEDLAFLDWLADNHFTFLGARDYRLADDGAHGTLAPLEGSGLGILSDASAGVLGAGGGERERPGLSAEVRAYLESNGPLIVTKSSARSSVHRRVHMDYVGVKIYDAEGRFAGEHRFVGLFTSGAYSPQPRRDSAAAAASLRR